STDERSSGAAIVCSTLGGAASLGVRSTILTELSRLSGDARGHSRRASFDRRELEDHVGLVALGVDVGVLVDLGVDAGLVGDHPDRVAVAEEVLQLDLNGVE